ncbi:hypothetical protein F4820DRAFT_335137 [Hypoxylon rubiginosum]|uniref:Uncharacterized protein n=1 Tax=Hypoxylon rubiginosum TaxID=110542 RepID=A0ACB9YZH3_9PEZI|nr:hypothetical protein F4820DRAFT_335137 [Hypoxylon rubiginosum]
MVLVTLLTQRIGLFLTVSHQKPNKSAILHATKSNASPGTTTTTTTIRTGTHNARSIAPYVTKHTKRTKRTTCTIRTRKAIPIPRLIAVTNITIVCICICIRFCLRLFCICLIIASFACLLSTALLPTAFCLVFPILSPTPSSMSMRRMHQSH